MYVYTCNVQEVNVNGLSVPIEGWVHKSDTLFGIVWLCRNCSDKHTLAARMSSCDAPQPTSMTHLE